ncbi:hypothetical protein PMAYCL1PPCAC_31132, partial [Pristionchus mayeri]
KATSAKLYTASSCQYARSRLVMEEMGELEEWIQQNHDFTLADPLLRAVFMTWLDVLEVVKNPESIDFVDFDARMTHLHNTRVSAEQQDEYNYVRCSHRQDKRAASEDRRAGEEPGG